MRRLAAAPQESVASAAFVVDESGALLRNLPSHWYNHDEERLFATQLQLLAGSGVPTDFWLAEDFIRKPELAKRYRVIVFGGLYHIDAPRRRLLDALKGEGRTLVFLSGTGVVGGGEATGFDIVHERAPKNHRVVAEPGVKENMISFTDHHLLTKFLGNDNLGRGWRPRRDTVKEGAGVKVMARFSPDGEPAVAERASGKGRDAWKSVMIGSAAGLTPQYFNALVRAAGGYVPAPYGLQVDMNGSFVSVHAIIPGRYAFRLPRPCRVTNLKTGREVDAPGGVLALDLTAGETRWYGLDVPQGDSANISTREILSWKGAGLAVWNRVCQARDLACSDSGVTFVTTGSDSQLYCGKCDFVSSASQFLRFRVRSTAGGKVEVFWAAADDPNLSQKKSASFEMIGDGAWHDYELRPFWPSGKRIVKLRFDPPQTAPKGTRVDISEIAILENPDGAGPIDTAKFPGVMFRYATSEKRYSTLVWTTDASETMCRHEFRPVPDGKEHVYWFDLSLGVNGGIGYWYKKEWKGTASWFGVMDMRRGKALDVKDLRFVSEPPHLPADVEVESALPADGIVRVGYRSGIELVLRNLGTEPARNVVFELDSASSGLAFAHKTFPLGRVPASIGYDSVGGRLPNELVTTVPFEAKRVGRQVVRGKISYASESGGVAGVRAVPVECVVEVLPSLGLPKAEYVPEPKPIATRCEIGALSFPGWREHSWDRIRNFTPERKPLLGWYDEGNPEAVDWQIKWLVENGISYLLVDWFPRKEYVTERFHIRLNHWFEAFRKARYRRFLKFAVLWENQMKGHDVAFVEWIARHLADEFFSMPEYYRIDGRPVVYVWNKTRLDTELSDVGGCRKALEIIEAAAKAKGHKGVWFIAHRSPAVSRDEIESIRAAGFDMTAIYRYRGEGAPGVSSLVEGRRPFAEVEKTSLQHWRALQKIGVLPFLPSLTTGWDDRPWNGDHGFEIYGRTVAAFEAICRDALVFSAESGVKNMLVGPINEWGEGSYAEPNAEFGFGMYEAIRNTFGIKPAEGWPVNFTPKDVGLGPYPALPVPKVEDKMWPMSTSGDIIVEDKGDLADQLNLLKQYRLTGERMILDAVRATQYALATNVASDVRGSVHWLRLNRELFLLTGEVRYIDAIAPACCGRRAAGDDAKRRFAKVADLTVTRNVDHALFVNFYPDATIEMDGVTFAISRENSSNGRVKVTTRSTLPRNLRFRIPGKGTEPSKYMNRCIKAGTDTIVLPFET